MTAAAEGQDTKYLVMGVNVTNEMTVDSPRERPALLVRLGTRVAEEMTAHVEFERARS